LLLAAPVVRYAVLAPFSPCQDGAVSACLPQLSGKPDFELSGGSMVLSASDVLAVQGLSWRSARVNGAVAVRVSGSARGFGIGPSKKPGDEAQVLVLQKAEGHFKSITSALLLSGTRDVSFDRVIPLLPVADDVSLLVRLVRVPGRLEVRDLRAEWLTERSAVRWMRYGLMAFWGGVLGLLAMSWMNHALSRVGVLLALLLVLAGVLIPGDIRNQVEHWMLTSFALPAINEGFAWSDLAHISMFFLLALVLSLARPDFRPVWLLCDLLLLAACTEVLQLFVEGRQAGFEDVGLDLLGCLLGIGAVQMTGTVQSFLAEEQISPL
jgi:VanZ family protein